MINAREATGLGLRLVVLGRVVVVSDTSNKPALPESA